MAAAARNVLEIGSGPVMLGDKDGRGPSFWFGTIIYNKSSNKINHMVYIESMINRKLAFGALIALTPDGKVFYWNPGAEATFGYTSEEALGHSLSELIVPSDRIDEEVAIRRKALETKAITRERLQNWL